MERASIGGRLAAPFPGSPRLRDVPLQDPTTALPERYNVLRRIASGGMATVYEAEDGLLGRRVAVKVLAPHVAADPTSRQRFEREARTAARVSDHPNVATIYDIGEAGENAFIVMELYRGGTNADRPRDRGPVPRGQARQGAGRGPARPDLP